LSGGVAAVLTAVVGVCLLKFPIGDGVTRSSYDLPFALRGNLSVTNLAIVYLDEVSHEELRQPTTAPWDRSLHAKLVEQLTAEGAKAIVFDILFTDPSASAEADAQFARAIKESRRVILCGNLNLLGDTSSSIVPIYDYSPANERISYSEEYPYEPFRAGAVAWGNDNLKRDPDYGIRSFFPVVGDVHQAVSIPWLPAAVAKFAGAPESAVHSDAAESRWLNYYGPPGSIPSASYFLAVNPDGVPPGFFKDKIVFVGGQLSVDFSGKGKDEFRTPYSYWSRKDKSFAPGVEIHATAALNLMNGNWLTRLPFSLELSLILVVAGLAGFGLMRLQPLTATLSAIGAMVLIAVVAHLLQWHGLIWFAWLIPVIVVGVAMLCSIVINSVQLYVEKRLQQQEQIHYRAMMAELAKAADYARSLLPAPLSGEVESEWCFHPSEQLGGDAFGYYWIDPDHLAIYLLDVCGHGVGAALLSVSVLNTLRAQTLSGVDFRDPAAILGALNHSFRMDDQNNLYFSAWYGVYRRKTRELIYASGGHPAAILIGPDSGGAATVLPLRLEPVSPAVGCLDEAVYRSAVQKIIPGSRLLVFSDGVFEIFGPDEKVGTWAEFFASFNSAETRNLRPEARLKKAQQARGRDLLEDDFSLVELRFN
jgi:serine phosphatase RsbU (regulator of sigma subunit)/CHASE2 domain-containing sensor protein